MTYNIVISPRAEEGLMHLALSEPKAFAKASRFIEELKEHPKTGLGHAAKSQKSTDLCIGFLKRKFM